MAPAEDPANGVVSCEDNKNFSYKQNYQGERWKRVIPTVKDEQYTNNFKLQFHMQKQNKQQGRYPASQQKTCNCHLHDGVDFMHSPIKFLIIAKSKAALWMKQKIKKSFQQVITETNKST